MKKGTGGVMSLFYRYPSRIGLIGLLLLVLPACKQDRYTPHSLAPLINTKKTTEKMVDVTVRHLTKDETKTLFNGRGNRLIRKHKQIYPLLLCIKNNADRPYVIDRHNIKLELSSPAKVAARLYSHTARRVIGSLIIGTIGTAATLFGGFYLIILGAIPAAGMPALIKAGYVTLGLSGLIAVGTPTVGYQQGSSAYAYNCCLEQDVKDHTLIDPVVIKPNHQFSCLLFVARRSYRTSFSITLVDQQDANPLSFDCELPKGEQS